MSQDLDLLETQEWLDSLNAIISIDGADRANFILHKVLQEAKKRGLTSGEFLDKHGNSSYENTIDINNQPEYPGDLNLENKIIAAIRWNAAAMVSKANHKDSSLGGHIGTFGSAATLYEVGFNHFWRAQSSDYLGDLIYYQGHSSPGIYARSYLEGRFSEHKLDNFRQEANGKDGLSSYPHPWLMPDYWQFPTVSMGLGPIQAIYQARFIRYLEARALLPNQNRKIFCFCGDGEMDEPESLGCLSIASREKLNNLIFVVNCNLQRLDGPVRGNSSIIRELESIFLGFGWNVIKVIWGSNWDKLFKKDTKGLLLKRMSEIVDGEFQNYAAFGPKYIRENFFGKYPELLDLVKDFSDDDIANLSRGGHDPIKVYSAYKSAYEEKDRPTVILAKTIKGHGLGKAGEAQNIAHNVKKLSTDHLQEYANRLGIKLNQKQQQNQEYYKLDKNSEEYKYLIKQREKLNGFLPARQANKTEDLIIPNLDLFNNQINGSGDKEQSTTMGFVRIISNLCKDKNIGNRIVPIVPDEARTFGMEGLFRQVGIYAVEGQKYTPVDSSQVMYYKESKNGQILEEGLNEAGSFCSWLAAATSYSVNNLTMIPFYIYYSMFGFQRIGDLAWLAGDAMARGFLIGATSGRTTLNGEGLQHEDGHSHVMAATIPNCISYDPCFNYELAVIIQNGLERMYQNHENVFYYITTMNENYTHPEISKDQNNNIDKDIKTGIIKGIYRLKPANCNNTDKNYIKLLGSGTILREIIAAATILEQDYGIYSDIYSVTSFTELSRDAQEIDRWNTLNPGQKAKIPYVTKCLGDADQNDTEMLIFAATDYIRSHAESIRAYIPLGSSYTVLGTDGFGRSDTRSELRDFFEVSSKYIVINVLSKLVKLKQLDFKVFDAAVKKFEINLEKLYQLKL